MSLSNVKQITLATLMYAQDHGDVLPSAKSFKAAVTPYLRNGNVFAPPRASKGSVGYFFEPRLSGLKITSISQPAETAMILEGTPAKTSFPYGGKTPLGYVDGHVKMADAARVLKARTTPLK